MRSTTNTTQKTLTDKEKLVALLTEFGVEFVDRPYTDNEIGCRQGAEKVTGYSGFETLFRFDETGKFIEIALYE